MNRGVISMVSTSSEGVYIEVGLIGHEGLADAAFGRGRSKSGHSESGRSKTEIVVQCEGAFLTLPADILRGEFESSASVRAVI